MIPKKIHYCWFGGNPLPDLAVKCIESWKRYCPDYEIIEWNESNFDINKCSYIKEAYNAKKWAFVSDYARYYILYNYGGLYFDTDVEIIVPIEEVIKNKSFMGFEKINNTLGVNPGLGFGTVSNLPFYKEILDYYNNIHFINKDGSYNKTTIVEYTTNILEKHGLKKENTIQKIKDITIYPIEYFCPMDYETGKITITDKTISIHHYTSSWYTKREKNIFNFERRFLNKYGQVRKDLLIKNLFYRFIKNLYINGLMNTLKKLKIKIRVFKF